MPFPFEVTFEEVQAEIDAYVDEVFAALQSGFLTLPKGPGFIEYAPFDNAYQALKKTTRGFHVLDAGAITETIQSVPLCFIVLRAVLGFTPSEWAEATSGVSNVRVTQGAARGIDRRIRAAPDSPLLMNGVTGSRVRAMVEVACRLLSNGPDRLEEGFIRRLNKADTSFGLVSIAPLADIGVPYSMLLYERFLGRPFAGHRDSVSELVGDVVETAIEGTLHRHGVGFRKTKRAERVHGFEQAPDFIIPDEFNPQVVIEAKLAEDDGTARDKVTRVQHLHTMSLQGRTPEQGPRYEVMACIAGRGFKQRREDMKKLLGATRGKVFALGNIPQLVAHSRLRDFQTKIPSPVASIKPEADV